MSGHSKWSQIKHKKAITDAKKGQLFSKIVREIMVAVRAGGSHLETNARLKAALERAKENGLPRDNIERAIERASGGGEAQNLQEFLYEVIGPGGAYILIDGITDNNNRTLTEIKQIISRHGAKIVPINSLLWSFEKVWTVEGRDYRPKIFAEISAGDREKLTVLLDELSDHPDVQEVYTNFEEDRI